MANPRGHPYSRIQSEKCSKPFTPKNAERHVQSPQYVTKREELQRNNKPYYQYVPKILEWWKESDYIKHEELYHKKDSTKVEEQEPAEISRDVFQFIQCRSVVRKPLNLAPLKLEIKPVERSDRWWIAFDTKVLLDDMRFIDRLVKSDPTCRLRLPYEVLNDLSYMTAWQQKAWMRIPAQRVVDYFDTAIDRDHVMIGQNEVENEDVLDSPVAIDAILNCCLQLKKQYYYVVVISDDGDRRRRAASVDIPSFSFDQVKALTGNMFTNHIFDTPKENYTVTVTSSEPALSPKIAFQSLNFPYGSPQSPAPADLPKTSFQSHSSAVLPNASFQSHSSAVLPNASFQSHSSAVLPNASFQSHTTAVLPNASFQSRTSAVLPNASFQSRTSAVLPNASFQSHSSAVLPNASFQSRTSAVLPNASFQSRTSAVLPNASFQSRTSAVFTNASFQNQSFDDLKIHGLVTIDRKVEFRQTV